MRGSWRSLAALTVLMLLTLLTISVAKKKLHITDDLDDVVDDEEDDAWKEWGKKKPATTPPPRPDVNPYPDFRQMTPEQIRAEMVKRNPGLAVGFVKLRPGVERSRDDVPVIAMRWTQMLRSGSVDLRFMAVDLNTIMFTLEDGDDIEEVKDFVLNQPEAYEFKIGEELYRRPGDPPLDVVIEKLQKEKAEEDKLDDVGGFHTQKMDEL